PIARSVGAPILENDALLLELLHEDGPVVRLKAQQNLVVVGRIEGKQQPGPDLRSVTSPQPALFLAGEHVQEAVELENPFDVAVVVAELLTEGCQQYRARDRAIGAPQGECS